MDPPEARAIRAPTDMTRSALSDPSRGIKIRLNMIELLSRYILFCCDGSLLPCIALSMPTRKKPHRSIEHMFLSNRAYAVLFTGASQREGHLSQL
jgi:hypothetical protein